MKMEKISVCRLCLAYNVPTYNILGTQLQDVFEKLTENPLIDGNKPLTACYICHAQLKKCIKLRNISLNAEAALLILLQASHEISYLSLTLIDRDVYGLNYNLLMTKAKTDYFPEITNVVDNIKELVDHDNEIKDAMKTEPQEFLDIDITEFFDNDAPNHSDSDTPLIETQLRKTQIQNNTQKVDQRDEAQTKDDSIMNLLKRKHSTRVKKKIKNINNKKSFIKTELVDKSLRLSNKIVSNFKSKIKEKPIKKVTRRKKKKKPREQLSFAREIALTQEETQELIKKRMNSSNYKNSPYKCTLCYKGYFEQRAYDNHMTSHDAKSGKFECDVCRKRYKTRRAIFVHIKRNHYYLYQCKLCPHTCRQAFVMKVHYKEHTGVTHNCEKCGKKFKKLSNYIQHARNVHSTDIVCTICGACLFSQKGLKDHMQRMHRDMLDHQEAEIETDNDQILKVHESDESMKCMECNLQFNNLIALRRHLLKSKKHRLEMQVGRNCLVCGELLSEETEMSRKVHMKKHFREINFDPSITCDECGKVCGSVNSYRIHKGRDHLNTYKGQARTVAKDRVICEFCGKNILKINLKIHQRTHTGERPYKCDVCGKRLRTTASFQVHKRTHTGEKPYECALCGARFNSRPTLVNHKRVHTGEKPYTCEICGKSFSQSNGVQLHVRTVHMKLPSKYKRKPKLSSEPIFAGHDIEMQ